MRSILIIPVLLLLSYNKKPEACFEMASEGIVGEKIKISSSCSIDAESFSWDFGDSNNSEKARETHPYKAGKYTVTLSAFNKKKVDKVSKEILIGELYIKSIKATGNVANNGKIENMTIGKIRINFNDKNIENIVLAGSSFKNQNSAVVYYDQPIKMPTNSCSFQISCTSCYGKESIYYNYDENHLYASIGGEEYRRIDPTDSRPLIDLSNFAKFEVEFEIR